MHTNRPVSGTHGRLGQGPQYPAPARRQAPAASMRTISPAEAAAKIAVDAAVLTGPDPPAPGPPAPGPPAPSLRRGTSSAAQPSTKPVISPPRWDCQETPSTRNP